MPMYDFKCRKCGHEFEGYSKVEKRNDQTCEKCGGTCGTIITANIGIAVSGSKCSPATRVWTGSAEQQRELAEQRERSRGKKNKERVCIKNGGGFKPFWHTTIDAGDPIYIESKRQLKDEVKKRNLRSASLGV